MSFGQPQQANGALVPATSSIPGRRVSVYWKEGSACIYDSVWPVAESDDWKAPPSAEEMLKVQNAFAQFGRDTGAGRVRKLLFRNPPASLRSTHAFADGEITDRDAYDATLHMYAAEDDNFIVVVAEARQPKTTRGRFDTQTEQGEMNVKPANVPKFIEAALQHLASAQAHFEGSGRVSVLRSIHPLDNDEEQDGQTDISDPSRGSGPASSDHVETGSIIDNESRARDGRNVVLNRPNAGQSASVQSRAGTDNEQLRRSGSNGSSEYSRSYLDESDDSGNVEDHANIGLKRKTPQVPIDAAALESTLQLLRASTNL